jgi:hypothetical protein
MSPWSGRYLPAGEKESGVSLWIALEHRRVVSPYGHEFVTEEQGPTVAAYVDKHPEYADIVDRPGR